MRRCSLMLLVLAACGGGETTALPTPGTLTLRLSTPNSNDGAVVVVVSGGPVNTVHAGAFFEVTRQTDGAGTHLLVIGDIVSGTLLTLDVPDIALAHAYVATLEQVADRTTFSLLDPAAYLLTITPVP